MINPAFCNVPATIVTVGRLAHTAEEAKAAGCEVFMGKPVDPDDLLAMIRLSLGTHRGN